MGYKERPKCCLHSRKKNFKFGIKKIRGVVTIKLSAFHSHMISIILIAFPVVTFNAFVYRKSFSLNAFQILTFLHTLN